MSSAWPRPSPVSTRTRSRLPRFAARWAAPRAVGELAQPGDRGGAWPPEPRRRGRRRPCRDGASTGRRAPRESCLARPAASVAANARSVLGGMAHDHVAGQVEAGDAAGARAASGPGSRRPCSGDASPAGRHRHPTASARADAAATRGCEQRTEQRIGEVVHLDRREPHPLDPGHARRRRPAGRAAASRRRGRGSSPRLIPVRTTSRWPWTARRATSRQHGVRSPAAAGPRTCGMTQ